MTEQEARQVYEEFYETLEYANKETFKFFMEAPKVTIYNNYSEIAFVEELVFLLTKIKGIAHIWSPEQTQAVLKCYGLRLVKSLYNHFLFSDFILKYNYDIMEEFLKDYIVKFETDKDFQTATFDRRIIFSDYQVPEEDYREEKQSVELHNNSFFHPES